MSERYYELAIEGPAGKTLGFVQGFLTARGEGSRILDAYEEGFDCESLRERLRELLNASIQTYHLLVPADLVPAVEEAVQEGARREAIFRIRDQRALGGARFSFTFRTFSREHGAQIRNMFETLPAGVHSDDTSFEETVHPESKGVEAYAPAHEYKLEGSGTIEGEIVPTLALHRNSRDEELINEGPLEVVPADT